MKLADVLTPLQEHQQRVVDKLKASGGVLALHGMGSGKTLEYIAAHDALGVPADYVVPAPLQQNLQKEYVKHTGEPLKDARVRSYEKAVKGDLDTSGLVVFDEAHRGRNNGTGAAKLLREAQKAPYRLLGTGTAIYNQPFDLANPLNAAAGSNVVPNDPSEFKNTFVGSRTIKPGFFNRIRGMKPVDVPVLKNKGKLIDAATGYVDVHRSGEGPDFPRRIDEEFDVPMSERQHELYKFHEGPMPWYLRAKIRAGLPMDKAESQELNAFQGALRQTANTPRPYVEKMTDEEENENTPKIQEMVKKLLEQRAKDKNFRGVVYSNYHGAGLHPYARALRANNVTHNLFTGETPEKDRARIIQEYNEGKSPVLLVSGAGTEGLDLKGTKLVQLTEPHWNNSRLDQAIARGIRFKSHAHLPDNEREVRVQRFFSAFPKTLGNRLHLTKPDKTVERYMYDMSNTKSELANQMMEALQEASDKGPKKPVPTTKTAAYIYGEKIALNAAGLGGVLGAAAGGIYGYNQTDPQASVASRVARGLGGAALGGVAGAGVGHAGQKAVQALRRGTPSTANVAQATGHNSMHSPIAAPIPAAPRPAPTSAPVAASPQPSPMVNPTPRPPSAKLDAAMQRAKATAPAPAPAPAQPTPQVHDSPPPGTYPQHGARPEGHLGPVEYGSFEDMLNERGLVGSGPFAKKQQAFAKHLWDSGTIPRNSAAYNQALSIGHKPDEVSAALGELTGNTPENSWLMKHLQGLQANPWAYKV